MKRVKLLYILLLPVCVMCCLVNPVKPAFADSVISWGVTPNTAGKTPQPPKGSIKMLEENNGIFVGDTQKKKIFFTFDLGYEAGYTAQVLDILKQNNIKGIFFLCGNYLKEKDLINRMIDEGHSIGNHTDKHKDLPVLSEELIKKDITTFQENFASLYKNEPIKFFRPPQGRFNEKVLKIANGEGLKTMLWSIAIVDWGKAPINAAECASKIAKRLHPGAIILSHITNSGTPEMLKLLIPQILEKGYEIGSPAEL